MINLAAFDVANLAAPFSLHLVKGAALLSAGPSAGPASVVYNLLKPAVKISQYYIKHRGILFASITLVSRCVVSKRVHGPAP
jgi:hypothetical protein